ncbi:MAG: aminotransferase class III-fold pyridoxal phosphate-dependent enzyme [Thermodesulfobacteriota bacterium]
MEYDEIKSRIERILATPLKPIPEEALARERKRYYQTHAKSLRFYEEAKEVIPGGVQHNLSTSHPFPLVMDWAQGYKLWDIDGNEYVDYLMCGAPIILGHRFEPLDREIIALIRDKGPATGLSSEYELLAVREIVRHMPAVEMVRFLQSGSEAAMAAIRLARTFTGRSKIIKVGGSYHGWSDQLVYATHLPGTGALNGVGIPAGCWADLIDVAPNDFTALEKAFTDHDGAVAGVILEPVGGESGSHPVHPDWNRTAAELCRAHGALFILDEVVTGFRLDMGGAQKYFGLQPDLTVLGKIIAHGYPSAGAVAGRREVMNVLTRGLGAKPYIGGTLAANPISAAACYHALRLMEEHQAVARATAFADRLTAALNDLFSTRPDLPFFVYNYGPIMQYATTAFFSVPLSAPDALIQILNRKKTAEDYQMVTSGQGLSCLAGTRMYSSMQHDQEALDRTLAAWEHLLGLIPKS